MRRCPPWSEAYLRDLPDLVGRLRVVRDHRTVPAEWTPATNPLGLYRLTPDRIRRKTGEEIEGELLTAENERSGRLRHVYEVIGLVVTAHKDGTLLLRWSLGERILPAVTEYERARISDESSRRTRRGSPAGSALRLVSPRVPLLPPAVQPRLDLRLRPALSRFVVDPPS